MITAIDPPIAPTIPPVEHLRERLHRAQTEVTLLRAQLRLAIRRDREQEKLRQAQQEGTHHAH